MNLETKITIYKFTPQLFTLTRFFPVGGYVSHGTVRKAPPCPFSGGSGSGNPLRVLMF